MVKIVTGSADRPGTKIERGAVSEKKIRAPDGSTSILRSIDAGSQTLGDDLRYVFSKNVAKARRDNKRLIGAADVAVAKR